MRHHYVKYISYGFVAITMAALPLGGCTMANFGASAFGNNKLQVADLDNKASYTANSALIEARGHFRNNDFGYSAAYYKRVVELAPNDPKGYVGLGASYDRLKRYDLSDRVYASLYKLSGGTAQYYNNLGYSYMLRGNLKAALKNFRKAMTLDPENVVIGNNVQLLADAARRA